MTTPVDLQPARQSARVFISYRSQNPDLDLAQQFYEALKAAGHEAFMAKESIRLGNNWSEGISRELEQCDYFLLLLSDQSATSDMVIEEVRRAKKLHNSHPEHKPVILVIRVNFPLRAPLNYALQAYLNQIQQREWKSPADTPKILKEILTLLAEVKIGRTGDWESMQVREEQLLSPDSLICSSVHPPFPVVEPELPEGQVDLESPFYVERPPIESDCYKEIVKPGALIRVKAPRQMGKTSLMARILQHGTTQGYKGVPVYFEQADREVFASLDQFLQWFCGSLACELNIPERLEDYWKGVVGSKNKCTNYFQRYLLAEINSPLVLGLDDVDLIFQYPATATDFFGLLRFWHERAKNDAIWKKLRLVIVHSKEVYIPLNMNQSPFNVGLSIDLPELTQAQVEDLVQRHRLNWTGEQIEKLMEMVGGHPYLVRMALYKIARAEMTLEELLRIAPTEEGLYCEHLRRHLLNLEENQELLLAMRQVVAVNDPVRIDTGTAFKLRSMGLVKQKGNDVLPLCDLYRQYFRDRLRVN